METANSASPAVRLLGFLKHEPRERDPEPIEFEESDIVWSGPSSPPSDASASPPASGFSTASSSPGSRHPFRPDRLGLTAALSGDSRAALVQRKPSLDPTLSAATAARTIRPVAIPRSGSISDDLAGSPAASAKYLQSAPVNVPAWPRHLTAARQRFVEEEEEEEEETEEEMLPPHEIVARSHKTTFSVFEGVGRTLKGRDLRRVRNAVWQKTGFLD